jgi:hypothetical protein
MVTDQFGFPAALQWKGVSDLMTSVFSEGDSPVPTSAMWSILIAAVVGLVFEIIRIARKGRFPISPLAIGLAWFMHKSM